METKTPEPAPKEDVPLTHKPKTTKSTVPATSKKAVTTPKPSAPIISQSAPNKEGPAQYESAPKQKSAYDMSATEAYSIGKSFIRSGNYSKASEYFKSAADRGDVAASYEIALLYQNGSGVAKSLTSAFVYMKKAADAGYIKAFRPLGEMYHGGRGVEKDRSVAEFWYQKAADNGDAQARRLLNNM